jgi:hypothetical protein
MVKVLLSEHQKNMLLGRVSERILEVVTYEDDYENAEYDVEIWSYKNKPIGRYKRTALITFDEDENRNIHKIVSESRKYIEECPICFKNKVDCELPCGRGKHSFCKDCIEKMDPKLSHVQTTVFDFPGDRKKY